MSNEKSGKIRRFRLKKKDQYEDPDGNLIPLEMVSEINALKDYVAESLCKEAMEIQKKLRYFRHKSFQMMEWYNTRAAKIRKIKTRKKKAKAGYTRVTSFSGQWQAEITAYPYYSFGDGFDTAKNLMAEVIHDAISGDFQMAVKKIFDEAFAMDREGQVKISQIMKLMQYQIDDDRWKTAKDILVNELRVLKRQPHVSFRFRDEDGKMQSIPLDISKVI